jgi:hypothetical protein
VREIALAAVRVFSFCPTLAGQKEKAGGIAAAGLKELPVLCAAPWATRRATSAATCGSP